MSYSCTGLDGTSMAWCSTGKHFAPVEDFGEDASTSDGLAKECRVCGRDRRRERSEDPEVRAREKERAKERREFQRFAGTKPSPAERRRRRETHEAYVVIRAMERMAKPELTLEEAEQAVRAKKSRPPRPKTVDPRDVLPRRARYGRPGSWDVAPLSEWRTWEFLRLEKVGYRNDDLKTLCDLSLDTIACIRRKEIHPEVCARFEATWDGTLAGVHRNPYPGDADPPPPGTQRPEPPAVPAPEPSGPSTPSNVPETATAAALCPEPAVDCVLVVRKDPSETTPPVDLFPPEPSPVIVKEQALLPVVSPARLLALQSLVGWSRARPPSALAATWSHGFSASEVKRLGPAAHRQGRSDPSADLDLLARLSLVRKVGDRYVPVRETDIAALNTLTRT